jgi:hypothetical protein
LGAIPLPPAGAKCWASSVAQGAFSGVTRKGQLDASETRIRLLRDRGHLRLHWLSRRGRARACAGYHRRRDGHHGEAAAAAVPARQVRGRRGLLLRGADKVDGSVLQDAEEAAYFAFRKRLRNISQATSCVCNACSRMQDLDLKFVCHHGEFIKQKMSGRDELAGRDVILVHRLLKNGVNERLGGHAYALYSDPCIGAMGIDPAAQGLVEHRESIDIIGEVTCWVRDLETAWQQEKDRQINQVTREAAAAVIEFDIAAPRPAAGAGSGPSITAWPLAEILVVLSATRWLRLYG